MECSRSRQEKNRKTAFLKRKASLVAEKDYIQKKLIDFDDERQMIKAENEKRSGYIKSLNTSIENGEKRLVTLEQKEEVYIIQSLEIDAKIEHLEAKMG